MCRGHPVNLETPSEWNECWRWAAGSVVSVLRRLRYSRLNIVFVFWDWEHMLRSNLWLLIFVVGFIKPAEAGDSVASVRRIWAAFALLFRCRKPVNVYLRHWLLWAWRILAPNSRGRIFRSSQGSMGKWQWDCSEWPALVREEEGDTELSHLGEDDEARSSGVRGMTDNSTLRGCERGRYTSKSHFCDAQDGLPGGCRSLKPCCTKLITDFLSVSSQLYWRRVSLSAKSPGDIGEHSKVRGA